VSKAATYGIVELHPVSHPFPMHGCEGSAWLGGIRKVRRQSRFGQNLPQTGLSVFSPKTLLLPATYSWGIRQRKRATDGKSEETKRRNDLQTKRDFDASSVSRSFFFRC